MTDMVILGGTSYVEAIFRGEPAEVASWLGDWHERGLTGYLVFAEETREWLDIPSYLAGVRHRNKEDLKPLRKLAGRWRWAYNHGLCEEFQVLRLMGTDVLSFAELLGGVEDGLCSGDYVIKFPGNVFRFYSSHKFNFEFMLVPMKAAERASRA